MNYPKAVLSLLCSIVFFAVPSRAQQSTPRTESDFRIGIGVSLDLGSASELQILNSPTEPTLGVPAFYAAVPHTFSIPMRFGHFMIEPEIGIYSFSDDVNGSEDSTGMLTSDTYDYSGTSIRAGVGLYYTQPVAGNLSVYVGPRAGIITNSFEIKDYPPSEDGQSEPTTTLNVSRTDFFVGLNLGGEYFFSSAFSLGAEVGFEYLSLGTPTTTETPSVSGSAGGTTGDSFQTKEAIVARVYF